MFCPTRSSRMYRSLHFAVHVFVQGMSRRRHGIQWNNFRTFCAALQCFALEARRAFIVCDDQLPKNKMDSKRRDQIVQAAEMHVNTLQIKNAAMQQAVRFGITVGRPDRTARWHNGSPKDQTSLVLAKASTKCFLLLSPKTRPQKEICKPMAERNWRLTTSSPSVYNPFTTRCNKFFQLNAQW